jgi:hypothetical protein
MSNTQHHHQQQQESSSLVSNLIINPYIISTTGVGVIALAVYWFVKRKQPNVVDDIEQQQPMLIQQEQLLQQQQQRMKQLVEEKIRKVELNLVMNRPEHALMIVNEALSIDPTHFEANNLLIHTEISILQGARQQLQSMGLFPVRLNRSSLSRESVKLLNSTRQHRRHQRTKSFFADQEEYSLKAKNVASNVTSEQIEEHVQFLKTLVKTDRQKASADLLLFTWDMESEATQSTKKRRQERHIEIEDRLHNHLQNVDSLLEKTPDDADLILLRMHYNSVLRTEPSEMEKDLNHLLQLYQLTQQKQSPKNGGTEFYFIPSSQHQNEEEVYDMVSDIMLGKAYFYCALCAVDNPELEIHYINSALDHFPEMFEALSRRANYLFKKQEGRLSMQLMKDLSLMMQLNSDDPVFNNFMALQ